MNKKRVHTPEGVRDVYGTEYGQRSKLKAKLNKVFASYGYEGIRTPGFEFFDVFNSEKGTVYTVPFSLLNTSKNSNPGVLIPSYP